MARPDFAADPAWLQRVLDATRELASADPERVTIKGCAVASDSGSRWESFRKCTAIRRNLLDGNIVVHEWSESDPRDPHCHPWDNCTIILAVGYWEEMQNGKFWRPPGSVIFRRAEEPHRVELDPAKPAPVSLFITGHTRRVHGFHTAAGWVSALRYAREREGVGA